MNNEEKLFYAIAVFERMAPWLADSDVHKAISAVYEVLGLNYPDRHYLNAALHYEHYEFDEPYTPSLEGTPCLYKDCMYCRGDQQ